MNERTMHSLETKVAAVKAVVEGGKPPSQVADEFQVARSLVSLWVARFKSGQPLVLKHGPKPKNKAQKASKAQKAKPAHTNGAAPQAALAVVQRPEPQRVVPGNVLHEVETLRAENKRLKKKVQQLLGLVMEE